MRDAERFTEMRFNLFVERLLPLGCERKERLTPEVMAA